MRASYPLVCLVLAAVFNASFATAEDRGTLKLRIIDEAEGTTPARVEIRDASGAFHVAGDALRFGGDCDMSDAGAGYTDLDSAMAAFSDRLHNPYSNATQFYSTGVSQVTVPPGALSVAVFKGPEYRVVRKQLDIAAGEEQALEIRLDRWADMPAKGWYGADDHVHIQRPDPAMNPLILSMMQAEDLHVANLLQMGKVRNFKIAPQYAFGPESHYQQGNYILATGQETPRTHFLGHTITLGGSNPVFDPENYLVYRLAWEEATAAGGINGFAHAFFASGNFFSPHDGLAVVLPHDLLHFMEVLQFNRGGYEAWYDVLNLGFRVTPTAGTDYPCADQTLVGHERFYTRVEGELSYRKWLDAVEAGRTFVTTGPMAEFSIDGQDIGSEVVLDAPGKVRLQGSIAFDPTRDLISFIEVVRNGILVARFSPLDGETTIRFDFEEYVDEASWFALRSFGIQLNPVGNVVPMHFGSFQPSSNAHTAPIYVLPGPGNTFQASPTVAREWLARLEELERRLAEPNLDELGRFLEQPDFDGVPTETLRRNRAALLDEIAAAQRYFGTIAKKPGH
jgi:hypothetical protein